MRSLLVLLALLPFSAFAELHTITIDPPTQFLDGTPLDASLIKSFRVQCGLGSVSPSAVWVVNDEIFMPTMAKIYDFPTNGTWNCHLWTVMKDGNQSDDTPDLVFQIPLVVTTPTSAAPKAPTLSVK